MELSPTKTALRVALEKEAKGLRETAAPKSDRETIAAILDLLAGLRADGFGWEDISGAVERAAIRTQEGRVFSAEKLRTYFAQLKGRDVTERIKAERAAAAAAPDAANAHHAETAVPSNLRSAAPTGTLRRTPGASENGTTDIKLALLGADHPSNQPPKTIK